MSHETVTRIVPPSVPVTFVIYNESLSFSFMKFFVVDHTRLMWPDLNQIPLEFGALFSMIFASNNMIIDFKRLINVVDRETS